MNPRNQECKTSNPNPSAFLQTSAFFTSPNILERNGFPSITAALSRFPRFPFSSLDFSSQRPYLLSLPLFLLCFLQEMEPMNIDWNNIESVFVKDNLYEHFNAPKYFDFSAHEESIDDDAWFCRPGNISKTLDSINSPNLSHSSFEFPSEISFLFLQIVGIRKRPKISRSVYGILVF